MGVDLAVATPVFLDYTFVGLEGLPGPGEERFAGDMLRSPGGGAITAIGAVRLGLTAAVAAPIGRDLPGIFVRESLEEVDLGPLLTSLGLGKLEDAMKEKRASHILFIVRDDAGQSALLFQTAAYRYLLLSGLL